ncbi:MAG: hypothetical protein WDA71_04175 [Actinomycetota bacterium]
MMHREVSSSEEAVIRRTLPRSGGLEMEEMEEIKVKIAPGAVLIEDGTCPNGCSLMNPRKRFSGAPAITIAVRVRGKSGLIHLNPYYGVFEYKSNLELKKGDVVDVHCPHCRVNLVSDENCRICRIPMFAIHLPNGGEVRACPTVGCHNHSLVLVDLDAQIAHHYRDERRPKM